jgi:biofilm PGA synthesis N-glycosyltransferase PgaC
VDDGKRLLIISPVRNEAEHIETVARALAAQTRPPDRWLAIDDGSGDGTLERLHALAADVAFLRVLATPDRFTADAGDRLKVAAEARAFNFALATERLGAFTHVGKLDGDIELPPDYFERLLGEFDRDPRLGIGGGVLVERVGGEWRVMRTARHHVRGALKLYRRECFEAIGGIQEILGWDGIDQTYAQMRGYRTRAFEHLVGTHLRPVGTAQGALRGRVRGGENHWYLGFSLPWVLLKALKYGRLRPVGISGGAFLYGYLRSCVRSRPRIEDPEYRRFVRGDERRRMRRALSPRAG